MMPRPLFRPAAPIALFLAAALTAPAVPIRIVATPAGATVMLQETEQRLPSPANFDVKRSDKPYTFTVELAGYQSESVTFSTKSKQKEIAVALEPLQLDREVVIKSTPEGAGVTIDGRPAGVTPLATKVTFHRETKTSPWKTQTVALAKADYQGESFRLAYEQPAPPTVALSLLRFEKTFSIETKAPDGAAIEAMLTVNGQEKGSAPAKIPLVFTRAEKTKPWNTYALQAEIPTIYQPASATLTHDSPNILSLTLKPITELPVPLLAPVVEVTATGARMTVDQANRLALLATGERAADITGLARLTRFARRDQNAKAPLQALNSYAITPDGASAILALTMQDDTGKFFSALFLKKIEDDSGGLGRLIDNSKRYLDAAPVIAPDSSNILVFQSNRGDPAKPDIFRINFADNRTSGGVARITNDQRFNYGPTYTDSNREVVYLSVEPAYPLATPQLSTVKMDGALPTQFQITAHEVSHREPSKIYFTRTDETSGKKQIFSVEPDGRLETNVISDDSFLSAHCFHPVASFSSPARILFVSDRDVDDQGRRNNNIYVMNADGSGIQQLTANGSDDIHPSWSPTDPNVVYFMSNRGGAYNLWRLRLK